MWRIHPSPLRRPLVFYILGKCFNKIKEEKKILARDKNNNRAISRINVRFTLPFQK